jgi:hypothetical protein
MATEKAKATTVHLGTEKGKLVRFSHLHVFKPHLNQESKKHEFSVQLLIPKANTKDYETARRAFDEQLAAYRKVDGDPGPDFHDPIKDGDKLTDKKGRPKPIPGFWVIGAKTAAFEEDGTAKQPPEFVGIERDEKGNLKPISERQVKSGDWGRVSVNFSFYTKGDAGVGVYLNSLQKVRDGEALSSRKSATDEFGDYDDDDGVDPLA